MKYVKSDGTPLAEGDRIMPDHFVTTFTVVVVHSSPKIIETLKDTIQTRFNVVKVEETDQICIVR